VTPWTLSLITAPASLPVSDADMEAHARIVTPSSADLADMQLKLSAAVQDRENFTRRQFVTATWELWLDTWPLWGVIELPKPPLISVATIKYIDQDGTEQTWPNTEYQVLAPAGPTAQQGFVALGYGKSWPSIRYQPGAIKVRYDAGYGAASAVPPQLKQAILLVFGASYASREDGPKAKDLAAADAICWPFRTFVSMPVNRSPRHVLFPGYPGFPLPGYPVDPF